MSTPTATKPDHAAIPALVARRTFLKGSIATAVGELDQINAQLLTLGAGDYRGPEGQRALVIAPGPSVQPPQSKTMLDEIKAIIADDNNFKKLFYFIGGYKPRKEFRALARAILTPGRADKVLALLEKPSTPYVA